MIERIVLADGAVRYKARYRDDVGREHAKRFTSRQQAQKFLRQQQADLTRHDWIDPTLERTLLGLWAEEWLATTSHLKPKTRIGYRSLLDNHVLPRLGAMPVGRIDHLVVRRFVTDVGVGAEPGTVRNAYRVLKQVLDLAVSVGALPANPATGIRLPRSVSAEMHFLTPEQVMRLVEAMTPPYGTLVLFAAYTGLRAGEIGALRVGRVDLEAGTVLVRESLGEVRGRLVIGPTKTYASRSVRLPEFLVDELRTHLMTRPADPDAFVFTAPMGGALRHNLFYRREFKPGVARAGLPADLRFHDLTHTCAAMLIAQGAHPKAMQERLGHSTITVTLDRYGHLFPSLDDSLVTGLDRTYRDTAAYFPRTSGGRDGVGIELGP